MLLRTSRTRASLFSFASSLVALAGGAAAGLAAGPASAGEPAENALHVSVTAPAGRGCISAEELQRAVQKRVNVAHHTAVDVHIESADPAPGWIASVAVAGRAGHRSVKTRGASCGKLDDGLVLVVTLLVDPEENDEDPPPAALPASPPAKPTGEEPSDPEAGGGSWLPEKPAEDEPEGPSEPWPGARKPGDPSRDPETEPARSRRPDRHPAADGPSRKGSPVKVARAEEPADRPKKKVQFALGASAIYSVGLLPAAAPGVRGSLAWVSPTPVPIEASFTYFTEYEQYMNNGTDFAMRHVETMSLGLTSCPADVSLGRLHFGACAGMTVTRLQHRFQADGAPAERPDPSYGPQHSEVDHYMVSPTADLRFDITLWKGLRLGAGLEVMTPINRLEASAWTAPYSLETLTEPVIFQGRLGISLVLPP